MKDEEILAQIRELVDEEHALRERRARGELSGPEEKARVTQLEMALDQAWDLLRRRRARQNAGEDPDDATARSVGEVENYLQ
ncbi:DUF2630 family protein [Bailinhaonella thermotolerans]|uniref:DUF2630 family protein n=1 Tax=Bailinhaonella thermotolerans TaxID=1070861 RepID=A0A3A4BN94_9ACTN|nr:DUF2630 family protein [Bailinhaonella thermotolerans]RJL32534.1 DUF2630 family protein [Bailinhaonella thermotolerans]